MIQWMVEGRSGEGLRMTLMTGQICDSVVVPVAWLPGSLSISISSTRSISFPSCANYSANHQDTDVMQKDIRLLSGTRGDYDGITGVIGGPPCQGASIINTKRNKPDGRNTLMGEYPGGRSP